MSAVLKWLATRIALPLLAIALATTLVLLPLVDRLLADWFRRDVELRAGVIATSMEESVSRLVGSGEVGALAEFLDRVSTDERLVAVVLCSPSGTPIAMSRSAPDWLSCAPRETLIASDSKGGGDTGRLVSDFPLERMAPPQPTLRLVHDLRYADRRRAAVRDNVLAGTLASLLVLLALFIAATWWAFRRWSSALVDVIRGGGSSYRSLGTSLAPVLQQVRRVVREIEESHRAEIEYSENFTPAALQHIVRDSLGQPDMLVVSNREPYIHNRRADGSIEVQRPASGMVSALEPVMRACSGTWVAHGSGTADRAVVDRGDCIDVPPDAPAYRLRRVWLTEAEEQGYYYGFANEGLWPLCHLAYVRPEFRSSDWEMYRRVNEKFADIVAGQVRSERPVVLIQDFHFSLLPQLIRARRPNATITLFWHVPWPNAETFGVCPWKEELLRGLLSADILGFHTRAHCLNFLATVDRFLEAQIDHEHLTVTTQGHTCRVAAYPISIDWPPPWKTMDQSVMSCRQRVRKKFSLPESVTIALGVERWDFTKGILERLAAFEHLLTEHPGLRGRITLLQIAAPSRSVLPAYQQLQSRTLAEAARINERYSRPGWQPVVLIPEHQDAEQVCELYRAADICLVNSLHDGMNLVAKEFIAARDDDDGVLVLSTFAGASRELLEALIVNPYDTAGTARAIETAMGMGRQERAERMSIMRRTVRTNNVYRWAGRMLIDVAHVRQRQRLRDTTALV